MAREYARVKLTIWADQDHRALPKGPQHLYYKLLTGEINAAGIADWRPARIAALTAGEAVESVRQDGRALEEARFIVIDEATEEVLVRSFVRHDGVLKSPNMARAAALAWSVAGSQRIRDAIAIEVQRAASEDPKLPGLARMGELLEHQPGDPWSHSNTRSEPLRRGSDEDPEDITIGSAGNHFRTISEPFRSGSDGVPQSSPIPQPTTHNLKTHTPAVADATASETAKSASRPSPADGFEAFWSDYPRKVGKGAAVKAWKAATRKTNPQAIRDGLRRQLPAMTQQEPRFIPHPSTWLNGARWTDDPEALRPSLRAVGDQRPEGW